MTTSRKKKVNQSINSARDKIKSNVDTASDSLKNSSSQIIDQSRLVKNRAKYRASHMVTVIGSALERTGNSIRKIGTRIKNAA